jgi:hypothetical protein
VDLRRRGAAAESTRLERTRMERTLAETESRVAQLAREAERLSDDAARLRRVTTGDLEPREDLARRMATVTVTETERPGGREDAQAAADAPAATTAPPTRPLFTFGTGGRPTGGRTPAQRLGGGEPGAGRGAAPPASEAAVATPETVAAGRPHATTSGPAAADPLAAAPAAAGTAAAAGAAGGGPGDPGGPGGPGGGPGGPGGAPPGWPGAPGGGPPGWPGGWPAGRGGPAGPQRRQPRPQHQHRPRRRRRHRGPCASEPSRRASRPSG